MLVALLSSIQSACAVLCVIWGLYSFITFFHVSHRAKNLLNTKYVLISFTNLSETFLNLRRIQRDIAKNAHCSSGKLPGVFVGFDQT